MSNEQITHSPATVRKWVVTRQRNVQYERLLGNSLIGASILLAIWAVWLGATLPPSGMQQQWSTTQLGLDNWSLTWVGLDFVEVVGLLGCGALLRRGHPTTRTIALLTLPVFVLDAWFDVLTALTRSDLLVSATMALFAELPAAVLLGWVAWKALDFTPK